jgi:DMSO/TMAO reductase YedYZ molybdopterin-dependent catalytic subunit
MTTRRNLLASSGSLLLLGRLGAANADPAAPHDDLYTLPGKKPLLRRSFRPPNLETPLEGLRAAYTPNDQFFVRYHLARLPEPQVEGWRLRVGGASAANALEFSLDELKRRFERTEVTAVNQCSGNRRGLFLPRAAGVQWHYGAMGNARWGGVRLRDVLRAAGIEADALEVVCDGEDAGTFPATPDYVKSLPMDRALDENTLIAFEMNGEPLPHWHGAPARLVVPGWTATYWVKHLTEVRIEPKPHDGFWMKSAYRVPTGAFPGARFASQENAETTPITEILVNSLVTSHTSGATLRKGRRADVEGWAWDGGSGIGAVEFSVDGGKSWREASLGKNMGRHAWRGFKAPVDTSATGRVQIAVRATSHAGARQPDYLTPNPSGYHHNRIQTLELEVA